MRGQGRERWAGQGPEWGRKRGLLWLAMAAVLAAALLWCTRPHTGRSPSEPVIVHEDGSRSGTALEGMRPLSAESSRSDALEPTLLREGSIKVLASDAATGVLLDVKLRVVHGDGSEEVRHGNRFSFEESQIQRSTILEATRPGYAKAVVENVLEHGPLVNIAMSADWKVKLRFVRSDPSGGEEEGVEGVQVHCVGEATPWTRSFFDQSSLRWTSGADGRVAIPVSVPLSLRYEDTESGRWGKFDVYPGEVRTISLFTGQSIRFQVQGPDGPATDVALEFGAQAPFGMAVEQASVTDASGVALFSYTGDCFSLQIQPDLGDVSFFCNGDPLQASRIGRGQWFVDFEPSEACSTIEVRASARPVHWNLLNEHGDKLTGLLTYGVESRRPDGRYAGLERGYEAAVCDGRVSINKEFLLSLESLGVNERGCLLLPGHEPHFLQGPPGVTDETEIVFRTAPSREIIAKAKDGTPIEDTMSVFDAAHSVPLLRVEALVERPGSLGRYAWNGNELAVWYPIADEMVYVSAAEVKDANPVIVTFDIGLGRLRLKNYPPDGPEPVALHVPTTSLEVRPTPLYREKGDRVHERLPEGRYYIGTLSQAVSMLYGGYSSGHRNSIEIRSGLETIVTWTGSFDDERSAQGAIRIASELRDQVRLDPIYQQPGSAPIPYNNVYSGVGLRLDSDGKYSVSGPEPLPAALLVSLEVAGGGLIRQGRIPLAVIGPGESLDLHSISWVRVRMATGVSPPGLPCTVSLSGVSRTEDPMWKAFLLPEPQIWLEWSGHGSVSYPVFFHSPTSPVVSAMGMGEGLEVILKKTDMDSWEALCR